jgi:excisionase family DNA binding protein
MTDRSDYASLLTLREVSATLPVSERTVRRMVGRGELRAFRVAGRLRVTRDSVLKERDRERRR